MSNASLKQLTVAAIERDAELNGQLCDGLQRIAAIVEATPELAAFLRNPSVDIADKRAALEKAVVGTSEQARNTVLLLIRNRLTSDLSAFTARVRAARLEREGKAAVVVESAVELDADQQQRIKETLQKHTGREPELDLQVHPQLIGGIRITTGDTQFDGTIAGRLSGLQKRINSMS